MSQASATKISVAFWRHAISVKEFENIEAFDFTFIELLVDALSTSPRLLLVIVNTRVTIVGTAH